MHRRVAGGPEFGMAWEARRARHSQEASVAAPARWSLGTSTWRPSAGRGSRAAWAHRDISVSFVACPAAAAGALAPAPAPGARRRPMQQSARCVPLTAPGGQLRCVAASHTLLGGGRGSLLA